MSQRRTIDVHIDELVLHAPAGEESKAAPGDAAEAVADGVRRELARLFARRGWDAPDRGRQVERVAVDLPASAGGAGASLGAGIAGAIHRGLPGRGLPK